jgi:hypothetical protein
MGNETGRMTVARCRFRRFLDDCVVPHGYALVSFAARSVTRRSFLVYRDQGLVAVYEKRSRFDLRACALDARTWSVSSLTVA